MAEFDEDEDVPMEEDEQVEDSPQVKDSKLNDTKGLYAILGVPPTADAATIKRAYHQQSTLFHTDKLSNLDADTKKAMNEHFQRINEANQILSDPRSRIAYDLAGKKGVERLALIPHDFNTIDSISRALNAIDLELEAKRAAKLVGSQGKLTLNLNLLPLTGLFVSQRPARKRLQQERPPQQQQQSPPAPSPPVNSAPPPPPQSPTAEAPAAPLSPSSAETTNQTQEQKPPAADDKAHVPAPAASHATAPAPTPAHPPHGHPGAVEVQAQVRKVILEGKETYIMIPPESVQQMLRQQETQQVGVAAAQGGAVNANNAGVAPGAGGSADSSSPAAGGGLVQAPPRRRRFGASLFNRVMASLKPYQTQLSHSVQVPISNLQSTTLHITTTAVQGRQGATTSVKFNLETLLGFGSTLNFFVKVGVSEGMKLSARYYRWVSEVWGLGSTFVFLDGSRFLTQYTIDLTRKLSSLSTLTNSWRMTLDGTGFFRSTYTFQNPALELVKSLTLNIAVNSMSISAVRNTVCTFSLGKKNQKKCSVIQQLQLDPISAQTTLAYELIIPTGRMRKIGLGVSTTLPFSFPHPVAFPFFVSINPAWRCITQFHVTFYQHNHGLSLPLLISVSPKLQAAVFLLTLPWAAYRLGLRYGVPLLVLYQLRKARKRRSGIANELRAARAKAVQMQEAMKSSVESRRATESAHSGLVIINATYSLLNCTGDNSRESVPTSLDVTIALQALVSQSDIHIPAGALPDLAGFYNLDPAADPEERVLKVSYWFRGEKHKAEFTDKDTVAMPQPEHLERQ